VGGGDEVRDVGKSGSRRGSPVMSGTTACSRARVKAATSQCHRTTE
jgi:hypothetical protein